MPVVVETIAGLRALIREARSDAASSGQGQPRVALVPTMGALHDGHLALVDRARESADLVIVSIFINPLQFAPGEDLDRYPRSLDSDLQALAAADVVFTPARDEIYPDGTLQTRVIAGQVGSLFEGKTRRGHFDGVLTVVAKLINIATPDLIVFGQKDAQQVFLVKRMVADLDIDVEVATVETVRDDDGLALSSRNRYLDERQRIAARAIPRSLEAAESSADRGTEAVLAAAQSVLAGDQAVELDYLAVVDPRTFLPVDSDHRGKAIVLVAARVGDTRLIDNAPVRVA